MLQINVANKVLHMIKNQYPRVDINLANDVVIISSPKS